MGGVLPSQATQRNSQETFSPKITHSIARRPVLIRFEIEDTGIGISSESGVDLFEAFSQTDTSDSRRFGGTGLGLAICKQLAGLLGGDIGFSSKAGIGSLFWFTARLDRFDLASQDRKSPGLPNAKKIPRRQKPLRILVAEDNTINQAVIASLLERMGQSAQFSIDGREALRACRGGEHDIVFLDCQMPEMDGYTAAGRIRHLEKKHGWRRAFIVAMTADTQIGTRAKCESAGMDDVITKPIMMEHLQEKIVKADRRKGNTVPEGEPLSAAASTASELIDMPILDRLRVLSEGEEDGFFRNLIAGFLDQSDELIIELTKMASFRDFPFLAMSKIAHTLKGLCLNFGAVAMTKRCKELQNSAEAKNAVALLETLGQLNRDFSCTRSGLSTLSGLGLSEVVEFGLTPGITRVQA